MITALVDDHLLLRRLIAGEIPELDNRTVATTGLWYHRLCCALTAPSVVGSMSRQLGSLDDDMTRLVINAVVELPPEIELISLRDLGWPMAELVNSGVRLNLLSLEAIAAAEWLGADIWLAEADDNGPLRRAADQRGVAVRLV